MKQTSKSFFKVLLIVLLSAGVAGYTSYTVVNSTKGQTVVDEQMPVQRNYASLAGFDAIPAQPIDLTVAAEASVHAVVHIKATTQAKSRGRGQGQEPIDIFEYFFGPGYGRQQQQQQQQPRVGFGSGVIISRDGYIVTNNHVIENSDEIEVALNDNRTFKARLIGTDPTTDLALLKVEQENLPTLPIGDSDALKVGEWVLAVGNPFNLTSTVTAGIVSAKARSLGVYSSNTTSGIESFIQTDAAINRGNSGGALVNARGELVGVNSVLSSPTGSFAGYGFAIPTSIMTKVVADLKQYGVVQRAVLGIMGGDNDSELSKEKDLGVLDGVYVSSVAEDGAAAEAGIKSGDVIVAINGKNVKNMAALQEAVAQYRPGDKVEVKYVREKKEKTVKMTLKNPQGSTKVVKNLNIDVLGAAFRSLPDKVKSELRLSHGLEVTGLSDGKMKDAGVRKGFIILRVNGSSVDTVDDLEEILKSAAKTPEQALFISGVYPSGRRANYAVNLAEE